ncbi:MAG: hypothetical protein ACI9JN_000541 [Bacteroidia bacterium]|jgi:hypothetical protein
MKEQRDEYMYNEPDFISPAGLKEYIHLMQQYDFDVTSIEEPEIENALILLETLIEKHPLFLPPYEDMLNLIECFESHPELDQLKSTITAKWVKSCLELVEKENLENKYLPWGWIENRPLMRGIYMDGHQKWEYKQYKQANKLFKLLLKMNSGDNIGARYAEKATREKMPSDVFNIRFVIEDDSGSYYDSGNLSEWFDD